ncbi:MAG: ATP-dependent Clp protease proteolytic subunit [Candidatus Accumulibacter sp.]|jgi:ATP-dependent protease ClpP protease subunit/phage major head subunit gpT-like protein|nr:ATP-dependent Clp protease proteolytic subunit [Accumulibacter sp.]
MKWYQIIQAKGNATEAEILIYGDIGASWNEESITAANLVAELKAIPASVKQITVRINSIGGSVPDGIAIFNALRSHGARIVTQVDAAAYSIASYIFLAGDVRRIANNAMLMIHAPWMQIGDGNAAELRDKADLLDRYADIMATGYARAGAALDFKKILAERTERWFDAKEALAVGLATEICDKVQAYACYDADRFIPPHFKKESSTNDELQNAIDAVLKDDKKRREHIARIFTHAVPKRFNNAAMAKLMKECQNDMGCSVETAGQRILAKMAEGSFPVGGIHIDADDDMERDFIDAASDALLIRSGIRVPKPSPMAADLHRMGVMDMAARTLSAQGRATHDMSQSAILAAATTSTSDFPILLANTAGKALMLGYQNEPASHVLWTGEKEVSDFKTQTLVALSSAPNLEEVPELAEYTYGTFSEMGETFVVKTFGRLFGISRQALINDDLAVFVNQLNAFGAAARRLEADLVYGKLLGNPDMMDGIPLFHANHNNLAAVGSAITVESLGAARAAMRKQKGPGGVGYIDPRPAFLIVPVALETLAEQLLVSLVDPAKSNDTPNAAWVKSLTVVADPRLDEDSPAAWYLAVSPKQMDTIIRAYILGEDRPYYEEKIGFEIDGMEIKSRLDIGVGAIDFRGLYKNPGAN